MPDVTIPDTPMTRTEQYLAAANGQSVTLPTPMTREEIYLNEIATKMQGGGSGVTVEPLTVAENGTYTAPSGKAYSPVTVDVSKISGVTISEITIVSEVNLSANILSVVLPDYADYVGSVVFVSLKDKPKSEWVSNQLISANIAITNAVYSNNNAVCGMRYKDSKPQVFQSGEYQTFMMPGDKFTVLEVPVWTAS